MAENEIKVRLQSAYKSESEWTSSNPVLKEGEIGYIADSNVPNYARYKIGDGVTNWNGLKWGDQSIYDKVDGIEIGGRNLLTGTKDFSGWNMFGSSIPILDEDGFNHVEVVNTWSNYFYKFIGIEIGTYIISFYAKASSTVNLEIKDDSKNNITLKIISINGTEWKKYEAIISINDITNTPKISFLTRQANVSIFIKKIKLEKGNKATDWTPAPEDKADVSHTHSTADISSGTLSSDRLPTIPVSKGGTGLTSLTSGQALIGNGTGNVTTRAIDTTSGGTSGSTSLITSGAVYSGLSEKANSSHTHNYAGSPSAGGAANLLYLPRVSGSSNSANYQPGANRIQAKEFGADCSDTPSAHYYHILTGQGPDSNYNTQLALGATKTAVYYRKRTSSSWGSWKQIAFIDSDITGNAASATKSSQDASGNTITSSYAASLSVSGQTLTLKSKSGATLSTVTTQDTTYSAGGGMSLVTNTNTFVNIGVRSVITGNSMGTLSVDTGGTQKSVSVKGIGTVDISSVGDGTVTGAISALSKMIYPVGSIYISVSSTDPATLFGGTWERFGKGRVLVGVNEDDTDFATVEKKDGHKELQAHTHTLSAHTHGMQSHVHSLNGHTHSFLHSHSHTPASSGWKFWLTNASSGGSDTVGAISGTGYKVPRIAEAYSNSLNGTTSSATVSGYTGGNSGNTGGPSNNTTTGPSVTNTGSTGGGNKGNLQPYITVYMWKRTA